MHDTLLIVPNAPEGVARDVHLRELLGEARERAFWLADELHVAEHEDLRDEAADASTRLRQLRELARQVIEHELDEESALEELLAAFEMTFELAEHTLAAAELKDVLADDDRWLQVLPSALAIEEFVGAAFMSYLSRFGGAGLLDQAEHCATLPTRDALTRVFVAGMLAGEERPLVDQQTALDHLDELLGKCVDRLGVPRSRTDPLCNLRFAAITSTALWNLARIAQRDMPADARAEVIGAREAALVLVRALLSPQLRLLGEEAIDLQYSYDTGLAFGTVEPLLRELAERQGAILPRRANPATWLELLSRP